LRRDSGKAISHSSTVAIRPWASSTGAYRPMCLTSDGQSCALIHFDAGQIFRRQVREFHAAAARRRLAGEA
jgi:hypothetical protein